WVYASALMDRSEFLNNPMSRGLTRARLLRDLATIYDLCYNEWTPERRLKTSEKLIFNIMTTSSNMGYDANYSLVSNWMGVRYGVVLYASLVCDDFSASQKVRSRLLPFEWDAAKRLLDHIDVNINSNGWNTESLSYFAFNWSFIGPALVAYFNRSGSSVISIEKTIPNALNALWGYSTSSVSIEGEDGNVMQPDFSDDDPESSYLLYPMGLKLYPDTQKPYLLWMLNYFSRQSTWKNDADQLFMNILWSPENLSPLNPEKAGWLTYFDPDQGVALFRNRFRDDEDILAAMTATAKRVKGHQGFDNLGIRIIGLGSVWAVGAGRTNQIAGQSTLFPYENISGHKGAGGAVGKVLDTSFEKDGSGYIKATGSCMGTINHIRTLRVDYSRRSGAEAVIIVSDISDNGKIWRMNSPEFNKLKIETDGFRLISPSGSELKAVVFTDVSKPEVTSEKVRYGGETTDHNRGIGFHGAKYLYTNAIDCKTDGRITVVFTLQPKGKPHPAVKLTDEGCIRVGNSIYPDVFPKSHGK
ncbi:MAG TPA: hypothetical protein VHO68_07320, partial [Bacteroidales bacterium]|nr:hypothetical protein [Bacteroidales bacterium]